MFMKFIILSILLIVTLMPVRSAVYKRVRQPLFNNFNNYAFPAYYGGNYNYNQKHGFNRRNVSMFPDINDLEKYAMNKCYYRENDRARIERLERLAFGDIQSGALNIRYNNVRNAILSRPTQNYKTSLIKSIRNYLGGQITGYTPTMDINNAVYPFNDTDFGKNSVINYSSPWGGNGYKIENYGIGNSSSIKILD